MPIVTIECVVGSNTEEFDSARTQLLANRLGEIFGSDPGTTWIKLRYLDRSSYAENNVVVEDFIEPTFVNELLRSLPDEQELASLSMRISEGVAEILSRSADNTHVIFEPEGYGRVAFGGNLVKSPKPKDGV